MKFFARTLLTVVALIPAVLSAETLPLAAGKAKFFGGIHSASQAPNFTSYFNQVTPENAGKWGSVEATRDVMNWTDLDAAYALAKDHGLPFKMHNLIWGSQQPAWIGGLSAVDQLEEIKQWFAAVAARYPDLDLIDVVNEPIHSPPNGSTSGGTTFANYANALGGDGASGWDWVLAAFRLARTNFPHAKLLINEYSVTNDNASAQRYLQIIQLLRAENLIDGVGIQAHAFETRVPNATTLANLNLIASAGVPIYVSEFDVDGPTEQTQLDDYQRIFPVFWEHPAVVGVTLWGYRPGLWRDAQGAALIRADGSEKPAMTWLRSYLGTNEVPVVAAAQKFYISEAAMAGANVGTVEASDADGLGTLRNWQIAGGTGAAALALNAVTGQLTVANPATLNASATPTLTVIVTVSDGRDTSAPVSVTVNVGAASATPTRLVNISTRAFCSSGNRVTIGGFVISGSTSKRVLVRAVGPSLAAQGIGAAEVLADPVIEVHDALHNNDIITTNDNWGDNSNAAEITSTSSTIGAAALLDSDTKSSAALLTLAPGIYSFVVTGKGSSSGVVLIEVYDADPAPNGATFSNISSRAYATTGNGVTIGGFVISGSTPKRVLLRGFGPTLTKQGLSVSEVLADPVIELHDANHGNATIATNDDWATNANASAIVTTGARLGATPFDGTDAKSSALLMTLPPGAYSFVASGKNGASGIVLVEVYDAD